MTMQPSLLQDYSSSRRNSLANKLGPEDRAVHDWYRFVLSYPPHLVRDYIAKFELSENCTLLDPFCGTGTTLVTAKMQRIHAVGTEANPLAHFASATKTDWSIQPCELRDHANEISQRARRMLEEHGLDDDKIPDTMPAELLRLTEEEEKLILSGSVSPLPLHKTLTLRTCIAAYSNKRTFNHLRLALANSLVTRIGNLHFGPEVGVGKPKLDVAVLAAWNAEVEKIACDIESVEDRASVPTEVHLADAREPAAVLKPQSIDAVITSPPYPNEKDYTRTTRLESVILGFISTKQELRAFKGNLLRSNTRNVYKADVDDEWVKEHPEIQRIAEEIEKRRIELGKTSGFERLYPRVAKLYFGGMARHLNSLKTVLRPGANLAYVVGDQASYLRVMIRTGELLADIAQALGYEVVGIDLFRTRFATATKEQLREEVVVLRWPGD